MLSLLWQGCSALSGCSEHAHFISYVQNKPIVPVSHLFNAHPSVISHLLVPVELFCFGQSSHKPQNHLVINYSCWFKRTRTEWVKEIWSLSAFGNTNTSGCYRGLWPRRFPEFYQHHPLTLYLLCDKEIIFSFLYFKLPTWLSPQDIGQHILWKQCTVLLCCVWVLLGFFNDWLSQL